MSPLEKGINFVRDNPQLLYTIFLAVAIPLAFLYTSESFLKISRETADAAQRARIGIFQDAVVAFARGDEAFAVSLSDSSATSTASTTPTSNDLEAKLLEVAKQNSTMDGLWVVAEVETATGTVRTVVASTDHTAVPLGVYKPDPLANNLMKLAKGEVEASLSQEFQQWGKREWRLVRTLERPYPGVARAYIFTDMSMALLDQNLTREVWWAYAVLVAITLGIMLLLGRQARIVDYSTLYRKLAEVDKMKDDFVSMAAHELRSPLTAIRGYADLIRGVQPMNEKGEQMLGRIEHASNDLNNLIGDILDVARLQEGRMSFNMSELDPDSIISDVVESFKKPASDKGLDLSYIHTTESGPLPKINADPTRLRQILVNFVGNAVKYSPAGSVKVLVRHIPGPQEFVEIRISDTGLGIAAEAQRHLFEKFYRVKTDQTSKIVGTGLGLWITKEMVEKMNGTIQVESIEGKGSDFIVRFPIAKTA
jgi:signal transduction histidine kinase